MLHYTPPRRLCNARLLCVGLCMYVSRMYVCSQIRVKLLNSSSWKFLTQMYLWTRKEELQFCKSSASGIQEFFEGFFNIARQDIFPQFGSYLRKNGLDLQENFTVDVSLDSEVPIRLLLEVIQIWSPDPDSGTDSGSGPDSSWRRYALSGCSWLVLPWTK